MKRGAQLGVSLMMRIPFIGRFLVLGLFLGPFASIAALIWTPPWTPEESTQGTVTSIVRTNETFARRVTYEFEAGGRKREGDRRYVDLKEHPDWFEGAKVRVYYHPAYPTVSRLEGDGSVAEILWFLILGPWALWGVAWIWGASKLRRVMAVEPMDPANGGRGSPRR